MIFLQENQFVDCFDALPFEEFLNASITYNTRVRSFPDGSKQYYHSSRNYHRAGDEEKLMLRLFREYQREFDLQNGIDVPLHDGSSVKRKECDNMKRAVQIVYNIAKCNEFTHFITLTLDPAKVDRFDYESCSEAIQCFTDIMAHQGCQWLIVPEQHKKGAYHFHGLVNGPLKLSPAIHPKTGLPMLDKSGRPIYNICNFKYGFTTATEIIHPGKCANYLTKYMSKKIEVPKGKKRYWASRSLERPVEELQTMDAWSFAEIVARCRFFKDTTNEWGNFWLAEVDSDG